MTGDSKRPTDATSNESDSDDEETAQRTEEPERADEPSHHADAAGDASRAVDEQDGDAHRVGDDRAVKVDAPHGAVQVLGLVAVVFVTVGGLTRALGLQAGVLYVVVSALGVAVAAVLAVLQATSKRPVQQRIIAIGLVVVTTAALVGALWITRPPPEPPAEMVGDLNIAVAEFGAATDDDELRSTASGLSKSLTALLESEAEQFLNEDTIVEIRGPANLSPIKGDDRVERAENARELAEEINADVVLYGELTTDGALTELNPEFVLNDRRLRGALELTGHHTLGTPVAAEGAPEDAQISLRQDARSRIVALAKFMVGLTFYRVDQQETAKTYFEEVRDDQAWRDEDGKELVHLFLGNAEGKLSNFDAADAEYRTALELNPQFARAMIGQAELEFLRAFGDDESEQACTAETIDVNGLDDAIERYGDAAAAEDQPAISDVDLKASYGIARVRLCKYLAGDRQLVDDVRTGYEAVVDGFNEGRASVQTLAAESYADLALLASMDPQQSGDQVGVACEVVRLYELAIETSQSSARRAVFERNLENARAVIEQARESCPTSPT